MAREFFVMVRTPYMPSKVVPLYACHNEIALFETVEEAMQVADDIRAARLYGYLVYGLSAGFVAEGKPCTDEQVEVH